MPLGHPIDISQQAKRRAYLIGLPAGVVTAGFRAFALYQADAANLYHLTALPLLALYLFALLILALFIKDLNRVSIGLIFGLSAYFYGSTLFLPETPLELISTLSETTPWIGVIYLVSFWLVGGVRALGFSIAYAALVSVTLISLHAGAFLGQGAALERSALTTLVAYSIATITGLWILSRTVADKTKTALHMTELATHDALTGLPNRLALDSALSRMLDEHVPGETIAVLFLDVDGLKMVNDAYGHAAGDFLIKSVAARLEQHLRPEDFVCRVSGDEFVIVCRKVGEHAGVRAVASRLRSALDAPVEVDERSVSVSASVGAALFPQDGSSADDLVSKADAAMYLVKKSGKNGFSFYGEGENARARRRAELTQALRRALKSGAGLALAFQPIVEASTGRTTKVEALARWHDPVLGRIGPDEFIPAAEESGLIKPLADWVLHEACRQAAHWPDEAVRVCVNISAFELMQADFVHRVERALKAAGLEPERLELELTETVLVQAFAQVGEHMTRLRAQGVAAALDDFGTGYSSLTYLKDIAFDTVKLDRSFVNELEGERLTPYAAAVVRSVVDIAATLGLEVVAEGVESAEQASLLRSLGCSALQGYYFARPMTAQDIGDYLATPRTLTASL